MRGVIETIQGALGEQILIVNSKLHEARDKNDLDLYLRYKIKMDELERAREVFK